LDEINLQEGLITTSE